MSEEKSEETKVPPTPIRIPKMPKREDASEFLRRLDDEGRDQIDESIPLPDELQLPTRDPSWIPEVVAGRERHTSGHGNFLSQDARYRGTDRAGTPGPAIITPKTKK